MKNINNVKLNIDLIETRLAVLDMNHTQLAENIGYGHSWWHGVVNRGGQVTPNKAKLVAKVLDLDYDQVIIKEKKEPEQITIGMQNPVMDMVNALVRIEKKVNELYNALI